MRSALLTPGGLLEDHHFFFPPHTSCSTLHGNFLVPACSRPCTPPPPPQPLMCWCAWQAMGAAEERTPVYCNKTVVLHLEFVCGVCFRSQCPVCLRQSQSLSQNTDNSSFSGFATTHKQRVSSAPDLETLTPTLLSGFWPLAALNGWCLFTGKKPLWAFERERKKVESFAIAY